MSNEKGETKTIYDLALHEEMMICSGLYVLRVPGGWRYLDMDGDNKSNTSCFVPFDNEFQTD